MTREQAALVVQKTAFNVAEGNSYLPVAQRWIDTFVALGMLEVEREHDGAEKYLKAQGYEPSYFIAALERGGFKIVKV